MTTSKMRHVLNVYMKESGDISLKIRYMEDERNIVE